MHFSLSEAIATLFLAHKHTLWCFLVANDCSIVGSSFVHVIVNAAGTMSCHAVPQTFLYHLGAAQLDMNTCFWTVIPRLTRRRGCGKHN